MAGLFEGLFGGDVPEPTPDPELERMKREKAAQEAAEKERQERLRRESAAAAGLRGRGSLFRVDADDEKLGSGR